MSEQNKVRVLLDEIKQVSEITSLALLSQSLDKIGTLLLLLSASEVKTVIESNAHVNLIEAVLKNHWFRILYLSVLKNEKKEWELIRQGDQPGPSKATSLEEKKVINLFLHLSGILLAFVFKQLNSNNLWFVRKNILSLLVDIKEEYEEFTLAEISINLFRIIEENKYKEKISLAQNKNIKNSWSAIMDLMFVSRILLGSFLLIIRQNEIIAANLRRIADKIEESKTISFPTALNKLGGATHLISGNIEIFRDLYSRKYNIKDLDIFLESVRTNNEKVTLFIILSMCKDLEPKKYNSESGFGLMINAKLKDVTRIKKEITIYSKSYLRGFNKTIDERAEWSNKILLISYKTLSALELISEASDQAWKYKVFVYEYLQWINQIHSVLNKYTLEDDWEKISPLLVEENAKVEWKSSFFTPVRSPLNNEIGIKSDKDNQLFVTIVETMIAMMNSEGGNILVGLIEKPDFLREELSNYIYTKKGYTFFDIRYELKKIKMDHDFLKRMIQEKIRSITKLSIDKHDNLWSLEQIMIKVGGVDLIIYNIKIEKATSYIYTLQEANRGIWVGLLKRLNARTQYVDPRDYSLGQ